MSWKDVIEIVFGLACIAVLCGASGLFSKHRQFCCPRCLAAGCVDRHEGGVTWCSCPACGMEWTVS